MDDIGPADLVPHYLTYLGLGIGVKL
jgi:hypothetical protein